MVDTLKKADDANQTITYGKLQKEVDSFMTDYAYTNDLTQRPKFCFAAGTMVHTNQGLIPIEQLKAGDLVLSKLANGELVYKPILRTIVTENVQVSLIELEQWVDPSLPMRERLNLRRLVNQQKPIQLLVTANHPFWIENKGWKTAEEMTWEDLAVNKDGTRFVARSGNNPYKDNVLALVYKTDQPDIGFVPYFDEDNPPSNGSLIRLSTADEIGNAEYKPVLSKLFVYDKQWKENLLGQLPENQGENAEFYGFKQGYWVDPETVEWNDGEGFLTTTVYNIEVADTHTYFVGEAGIWVHNCETTSHNLTVEMVESLLSTSK